MREGGINREDSGKGRRWSVGEGNQNCKEILGMKKVVINREELLNIY